MVQISFLAIFLTIIVIIILIIITLIVIKNREPSNNNNYTSPQRWSTPVASDNPAKNTCQIYTFPTTKINISSIETILPGVPTLNSNILNNLTGSTILNNCLDNDQIMARQITHTCIGTPGEINSCYDLNNNIVPIGTTETYYSTSTVTSDDGGSTGACPSLNVCVGELSLISIDFNNNLKNCIEIVTPMTPSDPEVIMSPCDPTNENQLLRVTRNNIGQTPTANNQTAPFAQIFDRQKGLCLQSTGVDGSFPFFGECSSSGIDWLLLPPLPYCLNTDIPPKCSIKENIPFICAGGTVSAQQIVYVGNLDLTNMPMNKNCLLYWLKQEGAVSLYKDGNNLIVKEINIDKNDKYVAQYINLNLYNYLIKQNACELLNQTNNCLPF